MAQVAVHQLIVLTSIRSAGVTGTIQENAPFDGLSVTVIYTGVPTTHNPLVAVTLKTFTLS